MSKKRIKSRRKGTSLRKVPLPVSPKDFSNHTIILFFVALVIVSVISSILYIQTLDKVAVKPQKITSTSQNFHLELVNDAALKPPRQPSAQEEFISLQIQDSKTQK